MFSVTEDTAWAVVRNRSFMKMGHVNSLCIIYLELSDWSWSTILLNQISVHPRPSWCDTPAIFTTEQQPGLSIRIPNDRWNEPVMHHTLGLS